MMKNDSIKQTRQIICMKWGSKYGYEYVNRLYAMAAYQTSAPMRFVCLTDDRTGIRPEVECYDCPETAMPEPYCLGGWRKIALFASSKNLFGLTGDWLFLDLDVMITGSLDDFFTYKPEKSFVVMQNWTQPGKGIGNTSVYRFRIGEHIYLLENLITNHKRILIDFRNEQTYVSRSIKEITFWPDKWCLLFKVHCVPPWPQRYWKTPVLPKDSKVIAFPGTPNPPDALKGIWPPKNPRKRIYQFLNFIRPTLWIQEIWDNAENQIKNPFAGH